MYSVHEVTILSFDHEFQNYLNELEFVSMVTQYKHCKDTIFNMFVVLLSLRLFGINRYSQKWQQDDSGN